MKQEFKLFYIDYFYETYHLDFKIYAKLYHKIITEYDVTSVLVDNIDVIKYGQKYIDFLNMYGVYNEAR